MKPTQLKLKPEYRDKLKKLSDAQKRSMANMVECLIDQAIEREVIRDLVSQTNCQHADFDESMDGARKCKDCGLTAPGLAD